LVADALRTTDYQLLSKTMTDKLHQPYRLAWLLGVGNIFQAAKPAGAAAVAPSGEGPGGIAFAETGH
jgi:homoserine kinase